MAGAVEGASGWRADPPTPPSSGIANQRTRWLAVFFGIALGGAVGLYSGTTYQAMTRGSGLEGVFVLMVLGAVGVVTLVLILVGALGRFTLPKWFAAGLWVGLVFGLVVAPAPPRRPTIQGGRGEVSIDGSSGAIWSGTGSCHRQPGSFWVDGFRVELPDGMVVLGFGPDSVAVETQSGGAVTQPAETLSMDGFSGRLKISGSNVVISFDCP